MPSLRVSTATLLLTLHLSLAAQTTTPPPIAHELFPTGSETPLGSQIAALLSDPKVERAHWGIAVTSMDGQPIYGKEEGKFFRPASNAKLFTTAAAIAMLGSEERFTTTVIAEGKISDGKLHGNLVLHGGGDANFAGGYALPYVAPAKRPKDAPTKPPLSDIDELAAQVAAKGIRSIDGDIIGDDTAFEHSPYGESWAIDDMLWGYGAPVSALTIHDNQIDVTMTPAASGRGPANITLTPDLPYYRINPHEPNAQYIPTFETQEFSHTALQRFDRDPGSRDLFIIGDLRPNQKPVVEEIAINDPAQYAAMALRAALTAHGVAVKGNAAARHRPDGDLKPFLKETLEPLPWPTQMLDKAFRPGPRICSAQTVYPGHDVETTILAEHVSPPLLQDIVLTAKDSQNLHAEIMLRNISEEKACGSSLAYSLQIVRAFWIHAGLDPDDFVFYDGSGLSAKDLVTPRAVAQLLAYAAKQPWFSQWKTALPVGGEDGTLRSRFPDTPLKEHLFAKTGTLGETRALSGYVDCASGKQVIFSVIVDNHTPVTSDDRVVMDKIVGAIAANN